MSLSASIALEGCLNFRDLGGYPAAAAGQRVRRGLLFRSDGLHHLTAADVDRLRDELRLGLVVDLRSSGELRSDGRGRLADEAIAFEHVPLFDGDAAAARSAAAQADSAGADDLALRYLLLAEFARQPIARVLGLLADCQAPAVYHCAAGKDRTGVISAVLLGLLGVDDEVIVADYALSGRHLDRIIERLFRSQGYREMFAALPPETLHANPDTMRGFLARLRERHGATEDYVRAIGVGDETIDRLRRRLLEDA